MSRNFNQFFIRALPGLTMSTKESENLAKSVAGMHSLHYTFAFLFLAVSRAYSVSPPKPAFGPRAELFPCVFAKVPEKILKNRSLRGNETA